jgi:hypothetical protein
MNALQNSFKFILPLLALSQVVGCATEVEDDTDSIVSELRANRRGETNNSPSTPSVYRKPTTMSCASTGNAAITVALDKPQQQVNFPAREYQVRVELEFHKLTSLTVTNPATGAWMKYSPTYYNDSWGYARALLTGSDGSTKEITNLRRGGARDNRFDAFVDVLAAGVVGYFFEGNTSTSNFS